MPRQRRLTPSYLEHKQSGRGRLVWATPDGQRMERMLPGPFGSPESLAAKARLELEIATSAANTLATTDDTTINELCSSHLTHAEKHYRRADASQTHEVAEYKIVHRVMRELYGEIIAADFGPLALKAVRAGMVKRRWCRSLINQRIGRVRRMFKWAASEELIPAATYQALATVTGLQAGRTDARESEPVAPVGEATVDATLPHMTRIVAGMVELQR